MSRARQKGTSFEVAFLKYCQENGFPEASRTEFSSALGDIKGLPITLECKNQRTMNLPEWLAQVKKSSDKTGLPGGVAHKRLRANIAKTYITFEADQIIPLLAELAHLRRLNN